MTQSFPKMPDLPAMHAAIKGNLDTMMQSIGSVSKTTQTAGIETAHFTKESIALGAAAMKKLMQARSPRTAMGTQMEYLKTSYERGIAQARTLSGLYASLAQEMAKPFENKLFERLTKAKVTVEG